MPSVPAAAYVRLIWTLFGFLWISDSFSGLPPINQAPATPRRLREEPTDGEELAQAEQVSDERVSESWSIFGEAVHPSSQERAPSRSECARNAWHNPVTLLIAGVSTWHATAAP